MFDGCLCLKALEVKVTLVNSKIFFYFISDFLLLRLIADDREDDYEEIEL